MGEVCNNVLRSSLTHIQLSRQTGKDNVFPPPPSRIRLAFDYETRLQKPVKHTLLYA